MDVPATADQGPDDGRRPGILRHPRPPRDGHERAEWDARTLVRLLSTEQLRRYAETTDRDVAVELIARERLRTWRRRDELRPTPEELAVLARPWRWARVAEVVLSVLRVITLVFGWTFLVAGVIGMFGVGVLIWVSALGLFVATLSLTAHSATIGLIDRMRTRPLLDWASRIPGQLGRGLPGSTPRSTVSGALDLVVFCVTVILVGSGAAAIIIAVLITGIELIFWLLDGLPLSELGFAAMMVGLGLGVLLLALVLNAVWRDGAGRPASHQRGPVAGRGLT